MTGNLDPNHELPSRAESWAGKLLVKPKLIRIQAMRRKWGSCSKRGTITLAADLADEDVAFQNFVIAHELLHLRIRNHGRLFKAFMTAHVPNWRSLEISERRSRGPSRSFGCTFQRSNGAGSDLSCD
jgi:predicted metal-dependent hydrolase